MEYPIYVVDESDSTSTQRRYSIIDDVLLGALRWEIWIVLLLTQSQQQHKFILPLQQIYFKGYAIRNQVFAVVESDSKTTKNNLPIQIV